MLTQIADSFQVDQEVIKLPNAIVQWFKTNLDNFNLSDAGLEIGQQLVETTSPLLGRKSGHLPHDLRVIVKRHVTGSLKKELPHATKKRGSGTSPFLLFLMKKWKKCHHLQRKGKENIKKL